jgi:hypothetical protein
LLRGGWTGKSPPSGLRSTLERQLEALGGSVAALGGKVARGIRGSAMKGKEGRAEVSRSKRRIVGGTWRKTTVDGRSNQRRWQT